MTECGSIFEQSFECWELVSECFIGFSSFFPHYSRITCVNQTKKGRTVFLCTQNNDTIRENISCVFGPKQVSYHRIMHSSRVRKCIDLFTWVLVIDIVGNCYNRT